jgi:hypothetical protein
MLTKTKTNKYTNKKRYKNKYTNKKRYKNKYIKGKGLIRNRNVVINKNRDGSTTFYNIKNGISVTRIVVNKKEINGAIKALNQSKLPSPKKTRKKRLIKFLNKFNFMRKKSKKRTPSILKKDSFDKEMEEFRESLAKPMKFRR